MIDSASTYIVPLFGIDELKQWHKTILECLIDKKIVYGSITNWFWKGFPFLRKTFKKEGKFGFGPPYLPPLLRKSGSALGLL
jgi:hypothetical protein